MDALRQNSFAAGQKRPGGSAHPSGRTTAQYAPANPLVQMQRTLGNRAVQRLLQVSGEHVNAAASSSPTAQTAGPASVGTHSSANSSAVMVRLPRGSFPHPLSATLNAPDVRFRVPEFERLKAAYYDKDLNIPEAVIKERVAQLLGRMEHEGRLKSKESVATIIAKIFPGPGKLDEAEFNNAVDVADRSKIYKSVTDANTKVLAADKPKLQAAMAKAAADVKTVEGDAVGLVQVFGTKSALAKANYAGARKVLEDLAADVSKVDAQVTTDYNLDDPEVGLGGWASFGRKKMHLLLSIAQVDDPNETKATLIHEAAHFANAAVDDHVYYADDGFFELDEAQKVNNAAHYEELPRRVSGTSKFDKKPFTPGVTAGGTAVTREDKVKAAVNLYLRKAWDAGVDAHMLIRGVRRAYLAGDTKPFTDNRTIILKISKLMDLTIHEQAPGKAIVTTLDVTLSESISRGVSMVGSLASSIPFPSPGALTDTQLRDKIVAEAVTQYGNLLKDAARDKALLDWLVAHYHSLPGV